MAKSKIIIISPFARLDLESIWRYTFDTWSLDQADKYQDDLFFGFTEIASNSEKGHSISNIKKGYRKYKVNHHYIIYKIVKKDIDIVRILHEKMDQPRQLL